MDETDLHCALCSISLKILQFNLKANNSKYSNTSLLAIIENIAGKLQTQHFDICLQCYDLLNELDAIQLRQIEIQNQFKKYIEHSTQNMSSTTKDIPENISTTRDNHMNLLDCNSIEDGVATELLNETLDIKTEVKFIDLNTLDAKYNEEENVSVSTTDQAEKPVIINKSRKRKKYPDVPKPHKCHCLKEFKTAGELKNHMNTHNNQRAFICEICGQSYKHKTAFTIHMDMHKGINPFTCIYCNKAFTQKGALVRHVPIHTGEMPYQCDECGKRFVHHTSFNVHRLSHTGLKSYKCTLCGLALMSASHLKRHMRIHTGEKKFVCCTCGKRFAEKYNLAVHEKLHTNPCSGVSQKRNYSCQICGLSFERKVKLNEHSVKEHQIMRSPTNNRDVLKEPLLSIKDNDSYCNINR